MSPHRYAACLVSVFALAFVGITAGLFFIEPFQGDLTRVGAFREAEYRWTEPQRYFTEPRTLSADSLDEYREPCDLLIIGDSFTQYIFKECYGWQEFIQDRTGLRILTIHISRLDLPRLFAHPVFRQSPPRFVIFESAEMGLHSKLEGMDAMAPARVTAPPVVQAGAPHLRPVPQSRVMIERDWQRGPWLSMDAVIFFYRVRLKTLLGSRAKAYRVPLVAGVAPFSSPRQDSTLVYYGDLWKFEVRPEGWARARERFDKFRALVEANHYSRFFLLVAPDRSTVYARAIAPNPVITPRPLSALTPLFDSLPQISVTDALQAAVARGEKDVYLPNDSHWGWKGHAIVGETVVRHLFPDTADR